MVNIPLFAGFHTSQVVVWDFFLYNYIYIYNPKFPWKIGASALHKELHQAFLANAVDPEAVLPCNVNYGMEARLKCLQFECKTNCSHGACNTFTHHTEHTLSLISESLHSIQVYLKRKGPRHFEVRVVFRSESSDQSFGLDNTWRGPGVTA